MKKLLIIKSLLSFFLLQVGISCTGQQEIDLITAAEHKDFETVQKLINLGVPVDTLDQEDGSTPLMYAAYNNDLRMLNFLLESGASVNQKNYDGRTALHWAAEKGHINLIQSLRKAGANPTIRDDENALAHDLTEHPACDQLLDPENYSAWPGYQPPASFDHQVREHIHLDTIGSSYEDSFTLAQQESKFANTWS